MMEFISHAADELKISRETIRKRVLKSKRLQEVRRDIHEERGDTVDSILAINLALAARKAKKLSKDFEDADDAGIAKLNIDKDGCEIAIKVAKMQYADRGYVEKPEVEANTTIPEVVVKIVRTDPFKTEE